MAQFSRLDVLNTMIDTGLVPLFFKSDLEVAKKIVNLRNRSIGRRDCQTFPIFIDRRAEVRQIDFGTLSLDTHHANGGHTGDRGKYRLLVQSGRHLYRDGVNVTARKLDCCE